MLWTDLEIAQHSLLPYQNVLSIFHKLPSENTACCVLFRTMFDTLEMLLILSYIWSYLTLSKLPQKYFQIYLFLGCANYLNDEPDRYLHIIIFQENRCFHYSH